MNKETVQIFLSYAREDEPRASALYEKLLKNGFTPWMDKKDILPGQNWKQVLFKSIRNSHFFLACLSNNSINKRGFIQKEIREVLDIWKGKLDDDIFLIPVRFENCEVPNLLGDFQWVNLFENNGFKQLTNAIKTGIKQYGLVGDHSQAKSNLVSKSPSYRKSYKSKTNESSGVIISRLSPANIFDSDEKIDDFILDRNLYHSKVNPKSKSWKHKIELFTLGNNDIIMDRTTNLMWQQSGSKKELTIEEALEFVDDLNLA
jgi:hypothetical protein